MPFTINEILAIGALGFLALAVAMTAMLAALMIGTSLRNRARRLRAFERGSHAHDL